MDSFAEKVAVITGAASGIGLAMATRFSAEGMTVVLADCDDSALAHAVENLSAQGARVLAIPTDVTNQADVTNLANKTLSAFGAIHILCNNAGIVGDVAPSWEGSINTLNRVMSVNVTGVFHGIHTFVPIML